MYACLQIRYSFLFSDFLLLLLLLLPLPLKPTVGFGLSNNVLPFLLTATNCLHLLGPTSTWRYLPTSSFHLFLSLPLLLVPSSSWAKILLGILSSSILSRWPNQLILCPFIHFTFPILMTRIFGRDIWKIVKYKILTFTLLACLRNFEIFWKKYLNIIWICICGKYLKRWVKKSPKNINCNSRNFMESWLISIRLVTEKFSYR